MFITVNPCLLAIKVEAEAKSKEAKDKQDKILEGILIYIDFKLV